MRIFNAISSWILWCLVVLYWLGSLFSCLISPFHFGDTGGQEAALHTKFMWLCLALVTAITSITYFTRRGVWFRAPRAPGWGFWGVTLFLFFCIALIMGCGFEPFYAVGDRSGLQWVSLAVAAMYLVRCFPRLPAVPSPHSLPPPIPQTLS